MKSVLSITILCICVWCSVSVFKLEAEALPFPRKVVPFNSKEHIIHGPRKRPFCNAFTGCGKKRSNLPALTSDGIEIEDSINSLLELSAEPAVEDLSRQIMSEAKLWEAIQEANVELNRRKQQNSLENAEDDVGIPARSATANCALPPCYI
ncbi:cardioactive peptide [Cylas formicarius]|uniref:cardioactive peptide n=1 Tax=Cylas formicarius TaxID=197179 RepID=UPI0029588621|nr:cardioactive peptide [Cylas formicarius]